MIEFIGLLIGFLLTVCIYSYVVSDNALYRLAVHILVGITAAYAAVLAVERIFLPIFRQFQADPGNTANLWWLVPLVLVLLLIMKLIRPVAWIGNSAVAVLIGVGSAVALVGAITGTLLPQITAASSENIIISAAAALLTICTLLYFQFTGPAGDEGERIMAPWQRIVTGVGRTVLMITFGALFAGLLSTSLVLLTERLNFYLSAFLEAIGGLLS
jgi:hypothetical protein